MTTTTTTEPAAAGHRAQRLASTAAAALTALLALWLLYCTALTSAVAASVPGLSGSDFTTASNTRVDTLAIARASHSEGEEGEEEPEEGEGEEEAASAEAEAEEAGSRTAGSPSNRTSGPPSNPGSGANVVVLSQLRLTAKATAALEHRRPSASTVGFSFTLSAPARVRVTLVKQMSNKGHRQWAMLPDSLTLSTGKGRVSRSLTGHNRLYPGRYRLTVKPAAGRSRSIYLTTRR